MSRAVFVAALSLGLFPGALPGQETEERLERPPIPAEAEATLADCRAWVAHLSALIEQGGISFAQSSRVEAEAARDRAMQACEAGNYHQGIQTAAEAVDTLEGTVDGEGEPGGQR